MEIYTHHAISYYITSMKIHTTVSSLNLTFHDRELILEALNILKAKTAILVPFIIVTPAKGMVYPTSNTSKL